MEETTALPCAPKLAFDTQKEADAAKVVAKLQRGINLTVYKCRYCELWHLASN